MRRTAGSSRCRPEKPTCALTPICSSRAFTSAGAPSRHSSRSTCRSLAASSCVFSGLRAAARPRCCASSRGLKRRRSARSGRPAATSRCCRRRSATTASCSSRTRCFPISRSPTTWPTDWSIGASRGRRSPSGCRACWRWWGCRAAGPSTRRRCRADSSSGWPWRVRWPRRRACCCSTNPCRRSMHWCACAFATRSGRCSASWA